MTSLLDLLRPAWMLDAACRGTDTALFFPATGRSGAAAKEICADCPVARTCHDHAEANRDLVGIWGGRQWTANSHRRRAA